MSCQNTRLNVGDVLDALDSRQRRELLRSLLDGSQRPRTNTEPPNSKAELRMQHCHVPKLVEYSIIERDAQSDEIREGPNIDDVRPMLEILGEYEHS